MIGETGPLIERTSDGYTPDERSMAEILGKQDVNHYLVVVDYYSSDMQIAHLPTTISEEVTVH